MLTFFPQRFRFSSADRFTVNQAALSESKSVRDDITASRRGPLHFPLCLAMLTGERFPARLRGGTRGATVVLRLKCSQESKARTRSPAGGRGVNTGSFLPLFTCSCIPARNVEGKQPLVGRVCVTVECVSKSNKSAGQTQIYHIGRGGGTKKR